MSSPFHPNEPYALLRSVDADGNLAPLPDANTRFEVGVARARPGTLNERDLEQVRTWPAAEMGVATAAFFDLMRETGYGGVVDMPEVRAWCDTPLAFCEQFTADIADDLPDLLEDDARDDDFDNHLLSPLREAMVNACPEFSGEAPDADTGPAAP